MMEAGTVMIFLFFQCRCAAVYTCDGDYDEGGIPLLLRLTSVLFGETQVVELRLIVYCCQCAVLQAQECFLMISKKLHILYFSNTILSSCKLCKYIFLPRGTVGETVWSTDTKRSHPPMQFKFNKK